jgi:hypothetical protein
MDVLQYLECPWEGCDAWLNSVTCLEKASTELNYIVLSLMLSPASTVSYVGFGLF